jgi:hypothetical protein
MIKTDAVQPQLPQLKVKLDWKEYYKKFSELHGGFPIIYKGRQLFADGWTYSATDYAGPEWEPPKDGKVLATMQKVYWYTRWNRARNELAVIIARANSMRNLQDLKSAPLQQVVVDRDPETNKATRSVESWDPRVFDHIIKFLEKEVEQASKELAKLKEQNNGEETEG